MSVTVVAAAVIAAGAPVLVTATHDVQDAQRRVDRAEAAVAAVSLAHSLADERDAMTEYVATGRSAALGGGATKAVRARVDRQIGELRDSANDASVTFADATKRLFGLPKARQRALSGPGSAVETFDAYTGAVRALHRAAGVAEPSSLGPLGRAVEQASGSRALLLGALASGGRQPDLTAAAQRTRLREEAALADFAQLAPRPARERAERAATGHDVAAAERYLTQLTDAPRLTAADLALDRERVDAALTARIDRLRGVETALAADGLTRAERTRDDEITALELRAAVLLGCLLLAIAVSVRTTRSVTRPLVALRAGARRLVEDPTGAEPVALRRRDAARGDEFAGLVQSVNQLHENLGSQRARVAKLAAERGHLIEERQHLAAQIAEIRQECEELRRLKDEVQARLDGLRERVHSSFVNLALRTLGLVERQLTVIETMEESEQDPERLDTLFTLDHLATGIRRYSENLLVIAGSERQSNHPGPVPLLDVLRAAISEVERYQRIRIQALPPQAQVAGFAADSISHLIAELLENATVFSPPGTEVHVSGWLMESGEVMLSVQDEGISMTPERFDELNARLADPVPDYCQGPQPEDPLGLGLYVVTRLAARHGVRVQLREQKQGGVTAVVVLPRQILPQPLPAAGSVRSVALRTGPAGTAGDAPAQLGEATPNTAPVPASQAPGSEAAVLEQPDAYDPAASRTAHDPVSHDSVAYEPTAHGSAAHGSAAHDGAVRAAGGDPGAEHAPPAEHAPAAHAAPAAPAAPGDEDAVPRGATFSGAGTATRVSGVASAPGPAPRGDDPSAADQPTGRRRARRTPPEPNAPLGGREHPEQYRPGEARPMPWTGEPWGPGPDEAEPLNGGPLLPGPREGQPATPGPRPDGAPAGGRGDAEPSDPWPDAPLRARARGGADGPAPADAGAGSSTGAGAASRTGAHAAPAVRRDPLVAAAERAIERSARQEPDAGPDAPPEPARTLWTPPVPRPADPRPADPRPASPDARGPLDTTEPRDGAPAPDEAYADAARADGPRTDKGLPKRTPRVVAPRKPLAGERRTVDAEALRRRLGGFQQGAREGRRDAEAEIAERVAAQRGPAPWDQRGDQPRPDRAQEPPLAPRPEGPPVLDQPARASTPHTPAPHAPTPEPGSHAPAPGHGSGPGQSRRTQPGQGQVEGRGQGQSDQPTYDQEQHHQSPYDQERLDQPPTGRQPEDRQPRQRHARQGHTQHQAGALDEGETVEEARS
ncbi:nitrate- and nitrite sensing domain-containing protein [Streptomyces buecherae]|uniref:nitrate- and nitrite sensing domain-containing protein n=1 Tax=Streptomyces buecherae TaxID=2763006 RepID=UPI001C2531BA|nr:nitrate- and nitrite sensing domain-containing protein [Streptomyces buecherae]